MGQSQQGEQPDSTCERLPHGPLVRRPLRARGSRATPCLTVLAALAGTCPHRGISSQALLCLARLVPGPRLSPASAHGGARRPPLLQPLRQGPLGPSLVSSGPFLPPPPPALGQGQSSSSPSEATCPCRGPGSALCLDPVLQPWEAWLVQEAHFPAEKAQQQCPIPKPDRPTPTPQSLTEPPAC